MARHARVAARSERTERPAATRTARLGSVNALERSLLAVTLVLVTVGVICVDTAVTPQSIANGGTIWGFMAHDLALVFLGVVAFMFACRVPLAKFSKCAIPMLMVSGALLVVVHFSGNAISGGQRWLGYGSISVQPSELFTLASCFYLAVVVARVERTNRHWVDLLKWSSPVLAGAILVFLEPDMGTASVIVIVMFGVFVLAGLPRRVIGLTVGLGALVGLIAAVAAPYRLQRILALFHPASASSAATYQVLQAKIALGAGRYSGLGFGQAPAAWGLLPNPHTDFIFAIIGEQFGFVGTAIVLALFTWLITLGMQAARRSPDRESQLLAGGITLWFGVEVFVNVASVVGWWPVTGIPLPLISYGGTSLIIDLVALGLLVNVARRTTSSRAAVPKNIAKAQIREASRANHPSGQSALTRTADVRTRYRGG
jgi:cell division protein FtsW